MVEAYDMDTVELTQLTKGWSQKRCMLAMVYHTPWVTLVVLLGTDVIVMKKLLGDIHMNTPSQAYTYVPR